jgi:hypothetical protein
MNRNAITPRSNAATRQTLINLALIAGLFILGGLCGVGLRTWIGGLKDQHAHLERCILASKQSHPNEDARSTLAHLTVEVPECMDGAGYEKALNNKSCATALWQGDVFCYLPRSYLGKLIYRMEAGSKGELQLEPRSHQQMLQPAQMRVESGER